MSQVPGAHLYGQWTWDPSRRQHYMKVYNAQGKHIDTIWSGTEGSTSTADPSIGQPVQTVQPVHTVQPVQQQSHAHHDSGTFVSGFAPQANSNAAASPSQSLAQPPITELPEDVQRAVQGNKIERLIRTSTDDYDGERLDARYRRVKLPSQPYFFVPGRVFKMLWSEPAGYAMPGKSRDGTHFSISTVRFGEQVYSEIRRFVVVNNCGTFSQCVPVHTYRKQGALKAGINTSVHGIIHTINPAPNPLMGEVLSKYPLYVVSTTGEQLDPESRINYGKPYAVEHNVKVLDIGMVWDQHLHMLRGYFQNAILYGQ